jgi:uncharacterized protein YndB with AHSA1/START domain
VGETEAKGISAEWEMKLTYPGGTYEEVRTMLLDAAGVLLSASYRAGGRVIGEARREGGRLVGEALNEGETVPVDVAVPLDAIAGVSFLFAATIVFEDGVAAKRTDLNEAQGFRSAGTGTFFYKGAEDVEIGGETRSLRRVEMKRGEDVMTVWVDEERVVTKIDWGGNMLSVLSPESTKHLFRPKPPAVTQMETGPEKLVVAGNFPEFPPAELYDHFTKPELLKKWWPQETDIEMRVGGKFQLSWPDPGWTLLGTVKTAEPGRRFAFTWKWKHMPDFPELTVKVDFEPIEGGGTRLTLTHGPYDGSEAHQKEREGHLQGWVHVLARLKALRE